MDLLRKQTGCILLSCFFLSVTGKDCQPRMCITIGALTIGGTMWCLSPSVSTVRMTFISLPTATLTPTPVCNITWPAWSAETWITCSGSSWASVWLVTACLSLRYCTSFSLKRRTHVSVFEDAWLCVCACMICTGTGSLTVPTVPSPLLSNNCRGKLIRNAREIKALF